MDVRRSDRGMVAACLTHAGPDKTLQMKIVVLACVLVALCGCAPKPFVISDSSRFAAPYSTFPGNATIYVLRDLSGVGIKWPVHIQLDGAKEGTLRRGSYTRFAASPGHHVIRGHFTHIFGGATPDVAVAGDFDAGETYYFVIGSSTEMGYPGVIFGSNVRLVMPRLGADLVRKYNNRTPDPGT